MLCSQLSSAVQTMRSKACIPLMWRFVVVVLSETMRSAAKRVASPTQTRSWRPSICVSATIVTIRTKCTACIVCRLKSFILFVCSWDDQTGQIVEGNTGLCATLGRPNFPGGSWVTNNGTLHHEVRLPWRDTPHNKVIFHTGVVKLFSAVLALGLGWTCTVDGEEGGSFLQQRRRQ